MPSHPFNAAGERPARDDRFPRNKSADGSIRHGRFRLRNRVLFGAVLEEMIECDDGTAYWRRCEFPKEIAGL